MEFRLSFMCILTTLTCTSVTSLTITVTPSIQLKSGQNLTITCEESLTGAGNNLLKLGLYKEVAVGTKNSEFQSVVEYAYSTTDSKYKPAWGAAAGDLQGRLEITPTFTDTTLRSGSVVFILRDVKCEDAAAFLCKSTPVLSGVAESPNRNISIVGVTQLIDLSGAQVCDSFQDQETCDNCVDFVDPTNGPKPKYARINQELILMCTANVDSSITTNAFRWYKKTKMDDFQTRILDNITDNSNPPPAGSCTYRGSSTFKYYPNSNDRELRIFCEAGSVVKSSESRSLSFCIEGLTVSTPAQTIPGASDPRLDVSTPTQTFPGAPDPRLDVSTPTQTIPGAPDPNQAEKVSGATIGAAVGGGIAAVVVVVLLFVLAIALFRKYSIGKKPADATRHPEEQMVVQYQHDRQQGAVYQDLSIHPDYENTTETQPYAILSVKGPDQVGVPVNETPDVVRDSTTNFAPYEDQYAYPDDGKQEYMEVCPPNSENTDYENKKVSSNYHNI